MKKLHFAELLKKKYSKTYRTKILRYLYIFLQGKNLLLLHLRFFLTNSFQKQKNNVAHTHGNQEMLCKRTRAALGRVRYERNGIHRFVSEVFVGGLVDHRESNSEVVGVVPQHYAQQQTHDEMQKQNETKTSLVFCAVES